MPASTPAPLERELLRVATRLFAERGFRATSVQEIVAAAGVTKGALYHYFVSKDDLLYEVYHRVLALQTDRLHAIVAEGLPAGPTLHHLAADVVETSIANLDDVTIFFREMPALAPEKVKQIRAERRRYHEAFRAVVQRGQQEGTFRRDVPADLVVHQFFGGVHHIATWYRPRGKLPTVEIARHFADLLLASVTPSGGPPYGDGY